MASKIKSGEIKARVNKDADAACDCCFCGQDQVLDMYDYRIGDITITLCDWCSDKLLAKCCSAVCNTNHRVKSQHDLAIRRSRHDGSYRT